MKRRNNLTLTVGPNRSSLTTTENCCLPTLFSVENFNAPECSTVLPAVIHPMPSADMEFNTYSSSTPFSGKRSNSGSNNNNNHQKEKEEEEEDTMPEIFKFEFMPSDLEALLSEILAGAKVAEVFDALGRHVGDHIEPLGWKAVWQPSTPSALRRHALPPGGASFLVHVLNVFYPTLQAQVTIAELLFPRFETGELTEAQQRVLKSLVPGQRQRQSPPPQPLTVPLHELFVVSEAADEGQYHDTAFLIELVRFFTRHVWRPWDALEEEGDGCSAGDNFVATRLISRLKMFWEMKNGIISRTFIRRVEAILAEGIALREQLNELTERLETPGKGEVIKEEVVEEEVVVNAETSSLSSDHSASETDARTFVLLKMKLQELEREMAIIEDGLTRSLYHELLPHKAEVIDDDEVEEEEGEEEEKGSKVRNAPATSSTTAAPRIKSIHLVVKKASLSSLYSATAKLTKFFGMNSSLCNLPLRLHRSLLQALVAAAPGDTIYLTAGVYRDPLPWVDKADLEVFAIENEVVLRSHPDSGDVLLTVDLPTTSTSGRGGETPQLKLTNVTLRAAHPLNHLVVVRRGRLLLNHCRLDCAGLLTTEKTVLVFEGKGDANEEEEEASLKWDPQTEVTGGGGQL